MTEPQHGWTHTPGKRFGPPAIEYAMLREVYFPTNNGTFQFFAEGPEGEITVIAENPIQALNILGADGWDLATQWTQIGEGKSSTVYTLKRAS